MVLAVSLSFLSSGDFWTDVALTAGIYALVALGIQLNVGFTGITNFGAAGFMAIGAYTMAILELKAGFVWWLAALCAIAAAIMFGLLVGLPSLRLRADYLAIATLAMAEVVRIIAQNARGLTGGNQGLFCSSSGATCYDDWWVHASDKINGWLTDLGWANPPGLMPLVIVCWIAVLATTLILHYVQGSPWGRVLRAIREDEDAARALGKNTFSFKLQSLVVAAVIGAVAGGFLALDLATIHPDDYQPLVTFYAYGVLILGGLASYWGVLVGAGILWAILEATLYLDLPDPPFTDVRIAALRFAILGVAFILIMAFRPEGIFGKREEMVLGE